MRQLGPVLSGIDKRLQNGSLYVSTLGLPDDEHDLTFHGGIDKAIHQYCSSHYRFWKTIFSEEAVKSRFVPGGFGENLVADGFDETNICIGDLVRVDYKTPGMEAPDQGCLLEVSLPRQPCFKLNQRFGIKNFAPKTHQNSKTGWYYRVIEEGFIEAGMEMRVVRRDYPKWSIARLHHYVHRDKTDLAVAEELKGVGVMGDECRNVFKERWEKVLAKKREAGCDTRRPYKLASKTMETPRIVRLELEAMQKSVSPEGIASGSYAVIQLPNNLKRAYSIVDGDENRFVLGVARDDNSRGGSTYIHDHLMTGSMITVGEIGKSMTSNNMASHYIFIVGGVGITAFLSMMRRLISINITLELHYAVRASDDVAFSKLLSDVGPNVKIYDKSRGARMNIEGILGNRIWNSQVFACGPQRMIDTVVAAGAAVGMAEDEVHYELFSADASGDPFTADVITHKGRARINIGSDQSLMEAIREAGLEVSSSCETGNCGTCRVRLKCGRVEHRGPGLTKEEAKEEMLSCVSRGVGHIVVEVPEDEWPDLDAGVDLSSAASLRAPRGINTCRDL